MKKYDSFNILPIVLFTLFAISVFFYLSESNAIEYNYLHKSNSNRQNQTTPTPKNSEPSVDSPTISPRDIAFISMIILGIGTLSTIILAWMNQRKVAIEARLRIEKLELEIEQLKTNKSAT
ncbi:MAG TPA: hypothetical protein VF644_20810 [Pyrinomonadaceae bacterium]